MYNQDMSSRRARIYRSILSKAIPIMSVNRPIWVQRVGLEAVARVMPLPGGVDQSAAGLPGLRAAWLTPRAAGLDGVVLYLHGGAYTIGSMNTHRVLASWLVRHSGLRVLLPEYRRAPEHPFPAAIQDALRAYRWLLEQGRSPARITLAGDSAGGGLCAALMIALRDQGLPLPAAAALLSPWTDLAGTGESLHSRSAIDPLFSHLNIIRAGKFYTNGNDPCDPLISPLYGNLTGLPPVLIHVGDHEVLLDDSTRLAERIRAAGGKVELVIWPEMWHVFQALGNWAPESQLSLQQIGQFLRRAVLNSEIPA